MNASLFIFWEEKVKPFFLRVWKIMQPRLHEKLGFEERMPQLTLWAILLLVTSAPVGELAMYLAELADPLGLVETFWITVALFIFSTGLISSIYLTLLLVCIIGYTLYKIKQELTTSLKSIKKPGSQK
jgi:hypothetical protein